MRRQRVLTGQPVWLVVPGDCGEVTMKSELFLRLDLGAGSLGGWSRKPERGNGPGTQYQAGRPCRHGAQAGWAQKEPWGRHPEGWTWA